MSAPRRGPRRAARLPGASRLALALLAFTCLLAARVSGAAIDSPADPEYRAALGLVYDGDFAQAEARLAALAVRHPEDPVAPYLQGLALEWRLEQEPPDHRLDAQVLALGDRALALAAERLGREPRDGRALLARGAAHGLKTRLYLFRWQQRPASREAVRMREALLAARAAGVSALDLDFGLGLYDYYAATLPRFFKIVAFVLGIPRGDRDRGLAAIAGVARGGSLFHDAEARVQMFEIHSFFERKPDRALHWIREQWRLHPGWPLWGLKLAQLLREPLGLFAESAAVCRQIIAAVETRRQANYQPVVAEMASALLAEALLLDLRLEEAREPARRAAAAASAPAWVRARGELALARSLELTGERAAAAERYRAAALAGDPELARRARQALASPALETAVLAARLLAASRRSRERGQEDEAERLCTEAFRAYPKSDDGRLCAAQASLRAGRGAEARALVEPLLTVGSPWLRPQAQLLLAAVAETEGDRRGALAAYRAAWEEPHARPAVRARAAAGLRRLDPARLLPEAPDLER